jgi:hypothetical protein
LDGVCAALACESRLEWTRAEVEAAARRLVEKELVTDVEGRLCYRP